MPNQSQQTNIGLQQIQSIIAPFLSEQDIWHGAQHVGRVVEFAKKINEHEMADPYLVEVGAWLHQFHDPNLDKLGHVLNQLQISPIQKDRLFEIVENCRPNKISVHSSHEARVVFDADAGDLMGPAGILREALCNYGDRQLSPIDAINGARSVQLLFVEKLQTEQAKRLYSDRIQAADQFWDSLRKDEAQLTQLLRIASTDG